MNDQLSEEVLDLNIQNLQKMIFLYNCVLNGWKVRRIHNNQFEFKIKKKHKIKTKSLGVSLKDYLNNFCHSSLPNLDMDVINIQKMIFIYNCLLTDWSVRMMSDKTFEFEKPREKVSGIELDDYLKKFIMYNLDINNLVQNPNPNLIH